MRETGAVILLNSVFRGQQKARNQVTGLILRLLVLACKYGSAHLVSLMDSLPQPPSFNSVLLWTDLHNHQGVIESVGFVCSHFLSLQGQRFLFVCLICFCFVFLLQVHTFFLLFVAFAFCGALLYFSYRPFILVCVLLSISMSFLIMLLFPDCSFSSLPFKFYYFSKSTLKRLIPRSLPWPVSLCALHIPACFITSSVSQTILHKRDLAFLYLPLLLFIDWPMWWR